ncbi:hypothetical protein [Streptomyces sp. UG1]|uniref:hypothetical protein n=1 Tax=Streptomyces sp. UG1 TaxID=3417652 RepID=UPI003CFBB793
MQPTEVAEDFPAVGPPVEDHVERQLLERLRQQLLETESLAVEPPDVTAWKATVQQIKADKAEARRLRADDLLSLAEFAREIRRLEEKERRIQEEITPLPLASQQCPKSTSARIVREWGSFTTELKRHEIERAIEAVVVKPAGKGGSARRVSSRPDRDRVEGLTRAAGRGARCTGP